MAFELYVYDFKKKTATFSKFSGLGVIFLGFSSNQQKGDWERP